MRPDLIQPRRHRDTSRLYFGDRLVGLISQRFGCHGPDCAEQRSADPRIALDEVADQSPTHNLVDVGVHEVAPVPETQDVRPEHLSIETGVETFDVFLG